MRTRDCRGWEGGGGGKRLIRNLVTCAQWHNAQSNGTQRTVCTQLYSAVYGGGGDWTSEKEEDVEAVGTLAASLHNGQRGSDDLSWWRR